MPHPLGLEGLILEPRGGPRDLSPLRLENDLAHIPNASVFWEDQFLHVD